MADEKISAYEQERLDNIARNHAKLVALGLEFKDTRLKTTEETGKTKMKRKDDTTGETSHEIPQPLRKMPRRGCSDVENYNEQFSEHYKELDRIQDEEKKRLRGYRRDSARLLKPIRFFSDEEFVETKPRKRNNQYRCLLWIRTDLKADSIQKIKIFLHLNRN